MNIELAIREYLISHGIKQTFVAEQCGWSKQKTNSNMTGKKKITAAEYGAIVGEPYDYFFNAISAAQERRGIK